MKIILITLIGFAIGQYDYSLLDNNPTSQSYQDYVGPEYFANEVTMHYFGSFTWGLCSSRFAQLNDVYESLLNNGYSQVKLVGIGYGSQSSSTGNWSNSNQYPAVCYDNPDNSTYQSWNASQRDFYLLDHEKNLVLEQNISNGLPNNLESIIINLINQIPEEPICTDGDIINDNPCNPSECIDGQWYEIIIDCPEQMGIMCENGIYIAPDDPNVCCSTCYSYGDINYDGSLNVVDIVSIVNLIVSNEYELIADTNSDGTLNIIDVVILVNLIIS